MQSNLQIQVVRDSSGYIAHFQDANGNTQFIQDSLTTVRVWNSASAAVDFLTSRALYKGWNIVVAN